MAMGQIEPFGGQVEDMRAGLGPSVAVNMNRERDAKAISWRDFFPWYGEKKPEPKPQTPQDIVGVLKSFSTKKAKPDGN
jgi:hypothetical protein